MSKLLNFIDKLNFKVPAKLFEWYVKDALYVFNYHEVSYHPSKFCLDFNLSVTPDTFDYQIKFIKKYFNLVSPGDLLCGNLKYPAALITFDDGYSGSLNVGAEVLRNNSAPSVFFMNMSVLNSIPLWGAKLVYLYKNCIKFNLFIKSIHSNYRKKLYYLYTSPSDAIEFINSNNIDYSEEILEYCGPMANNTDLLNSYKSDIYLGNHLYEHYNSISLDPTQLLNQYNINKFHIYKFRNTIDFFSYPFGQPVHSYNDVTNEIILNAGSKILFSAFPIGNRSLNKKILHRIGMFNDIDSEDKFIKYCLLTDAVNRLRI